MSPGYQHVCLFLMMIIGIGCLTTVDSFVPFQILIQRNDSGRHSHYFLQQSESLDQDREDPSAFAGLGEYDPSERLPGSRRQIIVGDPQQRLKKEERSVTSILKELAAIQQQGPQKYCILGTRHCSFLHQQIIELL